MRNFALLMPLSKFLNMVNINNIATYLNNFKSANINIKFDMLLAHINNMIIIGLFIFYFIRRGKVIKLEKKILILEHRCLNNEYKLNDFIKSFDDSTAVDNAIDNAINYSTDDLIDDNITNLNAIDDSNANIANTNIANAITKNQKNFNINKNEVTIINIEETLNIGLSIIIEDSLINYANIDKILSSRISQHKDTNYTYRLTRAELKKLVKVAIDV